MATNLLHPAFVTVDYSSPRGRHKQTIPTRQWVGSGLGVPGEFVNWDDNGIAADGMIEDFIDDWAAGLLGDNSQIEGYTIYNFPDDISVPQPVFAKSYPVTGGADVTGAWWEAVQRMYVMRTVGFGLFKLVLLDVPTSDQFGRYTDVTPTEDLLLARLANTENAFSGRDGTRPASFKNLIIKINDRLRREYGMV